MTDDTLFPPFVQLQGPREPSERDLAQSAKTIAEVLEERKNGVVAEPEPCVVCGVLCIAGRLRDHGEYFCSVECAEQKYPLWSKTKPAPRRNAVPAPEPSDTQAELDHVRQLISEECDALKELLIEKNKAYGNSALSPARIMSKASAEEQILVRIDDKLNRIMKGSDAGEDVVKDLLGYLILLRVARRMRT